MSPKAVDECVESVLEDNPEYSEERAYAICQAMQNRGELSVGDDASHDELLQAAARDGADCPDGQVSTGEACVPVESVDAPAPLLSSGQHLTLKSLDTEPIERVEDGEDTVRYKSLKLLSPGIWADAGSEQATYYPPEGIAALDPDYDESEHDGPPVNIMHDLDVDAWEAHEASVAGHVDPDTLDTDDDGNLFGDIVFDTSTGAGQFADENLSSTLEKEGAVGFGGPSVEIPARGLEQSHDPVREMPRVDGGLLTGVAMVMDPASKSVNFAREAARRPVALSADGSPNAKVLTRQAGGMSPDNREAIRAEVLDRSLQMGDIQDDAQAIADELGVPVDEVMEVLDPLLDEGEDEEGEDGEGEGEGEGAEMEDDDKDEDYEEEEGEDEDDDTEMQDGDVEAMQERMQSLESRLEDIEDAVSQAMQADDVETTLEEATGEQLAAADSVEELDRRLEQLESQGKESKTLADSGDGADIDYSEADSGVSYDPATGSTSR